MLDDIDSMLDEAITAHEARLAQQLQSTKILKEMRITRMQIIILDC